MATVSSSTKNRPSTNCSPSKGKTEKVAPATSKDSPASGKDAKCSPQESRHSDCVKLSKEGEEPVKSETVDNVAKGLASWAQTDKDVDSKADSKLQKSAGSDDATASGQSAQSDAPKLDLGEGELLSRGSEASPEKISQLQEMLKGQGLELAVDGKFGPETQNAVREYQRQNGLKVDGIVGPETQGALNGMRGESSAEPMSPDTAVDQANPVAPTPNNPADGNAAGSLEGLPPRADDALSGSQFMESIRNLPPGAERNRAILDEILSGNIPDSSRMLQDVVMERGGREIRLQAMPDYLAVGSDEDNVRVPMTPDVAQAIADRTGTSLPTTGIVDAIAGQSRQLHLAPFGDAPGARDTGHYIAHDQRIDSQLGSGAAPTGLVSGHKKDLVIPARDGRVAIYGGRWPAGGRVQSYSNVHGASYEDYSHGARLVSQQITVDGRNMTLQDALADPSLRDLLTSSSRGAW